MGFFDFEQQLVFYGQYHATKINVLVHVITVPLSLWAVMVALTDTGAFMKLPEDSWMLQYGLIPNGALLVALIYGLLYPLLEPIAGALYWPVLGTMWRTANLFAAKYDNHLSFSIGLFIVCFALQVLAHHFAEGRAPALMDSLVQALFIAPLFVFLEVLFYFGYRPALHKRVRNMVGVAVTKYRREKAAAKRDAKVKVA